MTSREPTPRITSTYAMLLGVLFSAAVTGLIWLAGPRLDAIALLPDAGPSWYYWKLPDPTFVSRFTVWSLYLAHQLALWGLIWWAQVNRPSYGNGLHRINVIALATNAAFILLHVAQTHLTYDGLAQDVSIWSSQGAVIVMLVWILMIENPRRGLVFGAKLPMGSEFKRFIRRYHGYFFAWAIVYTFWYHPAIATEGHLWGFFYTMLLLVQSSLFFTRAHLNRVWTFFLEATVLVHGALVAVGQGGGLWPMFAFGFGGLIVMTQMHGLGLNRAWRGAILAAYTATVVYVYSNRGWGMLNEIARIPIIEVLAALVLAGLFALVFAVARRTSKFTEASSTPTKAEAQVATAELRESAARRGLVPFLLASLVAYAPMVVVFWTNDAPIVAFLALTIASPFLAALGWWMVERTRQLSVGLQSAGD